ncbi:hypothetical protein IFR05_004065 [Cadophora sp. M221]|nr:hypothetical protein IFR05_004065 [Cadophora sp. M221]
MSEILGENNEVKEEYSPSTNILSIEWVAPSFPSLFRGGGSFTKFLVKTTDTEENAVYVLRYADKILRYESKHPLMAPFLRGSGVDGPQVSEEFSLEAIGHPVSKTHTNTPIPTPAFVSTLVYATASSGTYQSSPAHTFLQSTKTGSLQSRQYAMSSFCAKARHSSRKVVQADLQILDLERSHKFRFTNPYENIPDAHIFRQPLIKSLPPDFTPHPRRKMRTQIHPVVPTYGPLAKFLLFRKLPKELRLKTSNILSPKGKLAAHLGHTIGLQDDKCRDSPFSFKQVTLPWPLLNTCFESRQEALKLCSNFHSLTRYPFIGTNIHADSFWLTNFHPAEPDAIQDGASVSTWDKFMLAQGANRAHIRSLALSWSLWHGFIVGRRFKQRDLLDWKLKELVLVRGEQGRVESCGRGQRVVMQSPWSEKWRGEEVLVGRELERIRDMAQTEYEDAVDAGWDEQSIESARLRDLTGWVVPKVKMMEAVVLDDQ